MRDKILGMIEDLVANFMYYDRKNDEDCPVNTIEYVIQSGILSAEEMAEKFKEELIKHSK